MENTTPIDACTRAARSVRRRVARVRFARWLRRGHWIVGLLGIATVLVLRRVFEWRAEEVWPVALLAGVWLVGGVLFAQLGRPGTSGSLLMLDRLGGWKDRFSSAWAFATSASRTGAEELHVARASRELDGAVETFPSALRLPSLRWAWIGPALAVAFALLPLWRTVPEAGEMELTDAMREAAGEQAEELRREAERLEESGTLDEREKGELEELRAEVDEAAKGLAESEGLTTEEMLESLESRARAAEKLAEKLGDAPGGWASEQMLEEMRRHPDTVDLALAIEDESAELAAEEAMKLHGVLGDSELTEATADRFTATLERVVQAATKKDEERPVGERVGNASTEMLADRAEKAAGEFEALAEHFRFRVEREKTEDQLDQLAESLREAGSEVSGSELEKMKEVAKESRDTQPTREGLESLKADPLAQNLQPSSQPQPAGERGDGQGHPTPGGERPPAGAERRQGPVPGQGGDQSQGEQSQGEQAVMKAPVPGEPSSGKGEKGATALAKQSGGTPDGDDSLRAPVPGMKRGDSPSKQGSQGMQGMQGEGGQSRRAGGNRAGSGTAEMVETPSDPTEAANDAQVQATINEDGESTVRAVEGRARRGQTARRERRDVVTDFLAAEERALAGESLPRSRREHVIRYFSAIRSRFEESGGENGGGETP